MQSAQMLEIPISHKSSLNDDLRNLIKERILEIAQNNRMQCAGAMLISTSLGVHSKDVSEVANELEINISKCQLGCF